MKEKIAPTQPHIHLEMHRTQGHKYYIQADAASSYWSFKMDEESSDSTAVWLPFRGKTLLFKFRRMVMGDTNAGTAMQTRYSEAIANDLEPRARELVSNLCDDFVGVGDSDDELVYVTDKLFGMMDRNHITLKPPKVRLGFPTCEYFGFLFSKEGMAPTERNLCPIRQLQVPTNRKELQSVLGLFNFYSAFLKESAAGGEGGSVGDDEREFLAGHIDSVAVMNRGSPSSSVDL